jgi:hypothetical protein
MNAAAKKWVKALRSGKYEQGKYTLKQGDRYSCLGVACELAVKAGIIKKFSGSRAFLPSQVRDWLGLSSCRGQFQDEGRYHKLTLADLNNKGRSFRYLAWLIEQQPKGLFKSKG